MACSSSSSRLHGILASCGLGTDPLPFPYSQPPRPVSLLTRETGEAAVCPIAPRPTQSFHQGYACRETPGGAINCRLERMSARVEGGWWGLGGLVSLGTAGNTWRLELCSLEPPGFILLLLLLLASVPDFVAGCHKLPSSFSSSSSSSSSTFSSTSSSWLEKCIQPDPSREKVVVCRWCSTQIGGRPLLLKPRWVSGSSQISP